MASTPISPVYLALCGFLALVVGTVLIFVGRRGRRMDDHPICRRCKYDLSGLPKSSERCPECGAGLKLRSAVIIGTRQRRVGMMVGGTMVLLLGLAVAGWSGDRIVRDIEWIRYKPLSWLVADLESGIAATQTSASAELRRRIRAGDLAGSTLKPLIDRAIQSEIAASPKASPWRGILLECFNRDLAEADQVERYAEHVKKLLMEVVESRLLFTPSEVTAGGQLNVHLQILGLDFIREPDLFGQAAFGSRPGSLIPVSVEIDVTGAAFDQLWANCVPFKSLPGRSGRVFAVLPQWARIAERENNQHDLSIFVRIKTRFKLRQAPEESILDFEVKRKILIEGGVAADRTI
jgi:hypothetical protein